VSLKEIIDKDFIESYKAKEETKVSVLRMVKSAIKNSEISEKQVLTEEGIIKVLKKELKQRLDSISEYEKASRSDLVEKEKAEAVIIKSYLPADLSDEEYDRAVTDAILEIGATEMKDMGKVIALVMQKTKGSADGSKVSAMVRSKLSQ
jgi:uncharacterized protein YqeY